MCLDRALAGVRLSPAPIGRPWPESPGPPFFVRAVAHRFFRSASGAPSFFPPIMFSIRSRGPQPVRRSRTGGAPGGAGPYVIGPARPKAATPGNRGPAVARGGAAAPSRASRKRPKRLPALHPPRGNGKRDMARPQPQTIWAGEALAKRGGCTYKTATDSLEDPNIDHARHQMDS